MGHDSNPIFLPRPVYMISGSIPEPQGLLFSAWNRIIATQRPAAIQVHTTVTDTLQDFLICSYILKLAYRGFCPKSPDFSCVYDQK